MEKVWGFQGGGIYSLYVSLKNLVKTNNKKNELKKWYIMKKKQHKMNSKKKLKKNGKNGKEFTSNA